MLIQNKQKRLYNKISVLQFHSVNVDYCNDSENTEKYKIQLTNSWSLAGQIKKVSGPHIAPGI